MLRPYTARDGIIYLSIEHGILKQKYYYTYFGYELVCGNLDAIELCEYRDKKEGTTRKFWSVHMHDGGEEYRLGLGFYSWIFAQLVQLLHGGDVKAADIVTIKPYYRGYDCVTVKVNDKYLQKSMASDLPLIERRSTGEEETKDYTKRMQVIMKYVDDINSRLKSE